MTVLDVAKLRELKLGPPTAGVEAIPFLERVRELSITVPGNMRVIEQKLHSPENLAMNSSFDRGALPYDQSFSRTSNSKAS
jgi:hypothetical protein